MSISAHAKFKETIQEALSYADRSKRALMIEQSGQNILEGCATPNELSRVLDTLQDPALKKTFLSSAHVALEAGGKEPAVKRLLWFVESELGLAPVAP